MIALITDFGSGDYFAGVLKGVIKSINPTIGIIDICHDVAPFSIQNAQFILASSYSFFPKGTVFLVVVDPGVGSSRKGIIAADDNYCYVLPDNGILSAVNTGNLTCHELPKVDGTLSATFHGRDIFAPVAAKLALGSKPSELGTETQSFVEAPFPPFYKINEGIEGVVLHIDTFGNSILSIPHDAIKKNRNVIVVMKHISAKPVWVQNFDTIPKGKIGIYRGSAGFFELAIKKGSIAKKAHIKIGDTIQVLYD